MEILTMSALYVGSVGLTLAITRGVLGLLFHLMARAAVDNLKPISNDTQPSL